MVYRNPGLISNIYILYYFPKSYTCLHMSMYEDDFISNAFKC